MPSTNYQRYQKRLNFGSVHGWVERRLQDGRFQDQTGYIGQVVHDELTRPTQWVEGMGVMSKACLYADYTAYATHPSQKFKQVVGETSLFKSLYRLTGAVPIKRGSKGKQVPCVEFAGLEQCREAFAKAVHEAEWDWDTNANPVSGV